MSLMIKRSFFYHTTPGIIDALHNYKGIGVNFFNFGSKAANFQPGHHGKKDIGSCKRFPPFTKPSFPGINGKTPPHFIFNKICDFNIIG